MVTSFVCRHSRREYHSSGTIYLLTSDLRHPAIFDFIGNKARYSWRLLKNVIFNRNSQSRYGSFLLNNHHDFIVDLETPRPFLAFVIISSKSRSSLRKKPSFLRYASGGMEFPHAFRLTPFAAWFFNDFAYLKQILSLQMVKSPTFMGDFLPFRCLRRFDPDLYKSHSCSENFFQAISSMIREVSLWIFQKKVPFQSH